MKKITLLQSAFALIAAFMLALPARAQVASAADLFGTYKFTADVNVTDAGQALKDHFKSECEVVITKCSQNIYDGEIQGLAGATAVQKINDIDLTANTIKITNPNGNYDVWGGKVYMANAEGAYPFEQGNTYSEILYTFDPATKTITLPNFTLVTCDNANSAATIAASFTNAKLTLVQSESIEVTDLSGDWHFTAGKGTYDVMEGSTLPTEWDMTLTATDDTKKAYSISLTLGDFAPLALTATFDGVTLNIPFKDTYFDVENKIGLVYYGGNQGNISFSLANENLLTLTSGMYIAQDSISPEVKGGTLQYYIAGSAKRQGGETEKVTWEGTYKIKAGSIMKQLTEFDYPEEFDMVVTYNADYDMYLITNFMGNDVAALNYGGILLTPSADDPNVAEIATGKAVQTITQGEKYLYLKDQNLQDFPLMLTRLSDGTYTISDFSISEMTYNADRTQNHNFAAWYQTVTATKEETVKPEPFSWAQTFTVTADVQSYNDAYTYPTTFEMTVKDWGSGIYTIINFMGYDIYNLNGGAGFNVTSDTEAAIKAGAYIGIPESGKAYYTIADLNNQPNDIKVKVNEDGSLSIDNFCVNLYLLENSTTTLAAFYTNVKATVGPSSIENIEAAPALKAWSANGTIYVAGEAQAVEVYDMSGRTVFSGVASQVSGLNKGLYLVKVKNAVAKVAVK